MNLGIAIATAVVGYLLGSISFARMVGSKVAPDADLTATDLELPGGATIEYGGVSATSIGARTGPKWGIVTGVGDMAKAFIPTLVARLIWPDESYHLVAAVAVMFGHNYPIFYRFKGGRGQSPLYGGLLAVDWLALPITTAIGVVVGLFVIRDMLFAYSLGQWLLIPWFIWRAGPPEVAYAVIINLLYTIAMIPELKSYWAMRQAGELKQVSSWKEFRTSHPAMGTGRLSEEDDSS